MKIFQTNPCGYRGRAGNPSDTDLPDLRRHRLKGDWIEPLKMTVKEAAKRLAVTRQALNNVVN